MLKPEQVCLVAAHNGDLAAAQALGLRTAFVPRPLEYGPGQTSDLAPERDWDVVAEDFGALAEALAL
jgi:2-haloacid dehalogenase